MNGKIYYTDEEVDRDHKRFRICKNRGNDCNKVEFMATHGASKFCSEDCNTKFSNWEKQQIHQMILSPKKNSVKILWQLVQNNLMPIVSYRSLIEINFIFEENDCMEFSPSLGRKVFVFGDFMLFQWEEETFLIIKK